MAVGLRDRPADEDPARTTLCAFCAHSNRTVYLYENEDDPWKGSERFEDFDCTHPHVKKMGTLLVLECEGFALYTQPMEPDEKTKQDFEKRLLYQRNKQLQDEVKKLRKKLKKKGKKK